MSVTVVIPTFNRKRFEPLMEYNINIQDYYGIKEVIVLDDSDEDRPLCLAIPYPVRYYRVPRCSIGQKRNLGVSLCNTEYIAHMDTDDFYDKSYISNSIFAMIETGKTIAGSADMNMFCKGRFYKQRCMHIHMLNEATLVFKKTAWIPFNHTNSNEAVPFLEPQIKNIVETDIDRVMCCVCHDKNTIDKSIWVKEQFASVDLHQYEKHIQLLSTLNI